MSNATANEQLMLELVNRARLDPLGEAARFGININQGLSAGTISGNPVQPLAMNNLLISSARTHSQWMINTDTFSHTGSGGSNAGQRMTAAGYNFTGSWTWGENIARRGTTGTPNLTSFIVQEHQDLFLSPGHRVNILNANFREIGVGQIGGVFTQGGTNYNDSMVTQNFAKTATNLFLLGVAYNDTNGDKFYSAGEGRGGVVMQVQPAAGGATASNTGGSAGGYELAAASGTYNVTFSGGGLAGAMTVQTALTQNVKLDVVDGNSIWGSNSFALLSGVTRAGLYGVANIDLTGTAGGDMLTGNAGANILNGNAGNDILIGGAGNDIVNGGDGTDIASGYGLRSTYTLAQQGSAWIISGGTTGTDTLNGVESVQFSDQTIVLGGSTPSPPALPSPPPPPPPPPILPGPPGNPGGPAAAKTARTDLDGDGNGDILWQKSSGALTLWRMDGTQRLSSSTVNANPGSSLKAIGNGDFDGDGKADILFQNTNGSAVVWLMNGAIQKSAATVGANPGKAWHAKAAGDFDGDSKADILWQHDNGSVALWFMDGTTLKSTSTIANNPGSGWQVKDAGDFNGDGKADILWQSTNSTAALWLMDDSNIVTNTAVGSTLGTAWKIKGAGDFNGDGKADILWQNQNGQIAEWLMDGTTILSSANVGPNPGSSWKVKGASDLDGDGRADILLQNGKSAAVWLVNGSTVSSSATLSGPGILWNVVATSA